MDITIFYFSGTGNTKWAVKSLEEVLTERGHTTKRYTIESVMQDSELIGLLDNSDIIGFAYPLFGANVPHIMRMFMAHVLKIAQSEKITSKKVFFLNTFGYVNGHGAVKANRYFKAVDWDMVGHINLRLTNSAPSKTDLRAKTGEALPESVKEKARKHLGKW